MSKVYFQNYDAVSKALKYILNDLNKRNVSFPKGVTDLRALTAQPFDLFQKTPGWMLQQFIKENQNLITQMAKNPAMTAGNYKWNSAQREAFKNSLADTAFYVGPNANQSNGDMMSQQSPQQSSSGWKLPTGGEQPSSSSTNSSQAIGNIVTGGLKTLWSYLKENQNNRANLNKNAELSDVSVGVAPKNTKINTISSYLAQLDKDTTIAKQNSFKKKMNDAMKDRTNIAWLTLPGATLDSNGNWKSRVVRRIKPFKSQNVEKQQSIARNDRTPANSTVYTSPMLTYLNSWLKSLGYQGMGPISKDGLPIFLGRYYDNTTNRVRTISKPHLIVNTSDWNAVYQKQLYRLAYIWNQYARQQQKVVNHIKNKANWNNIVAKKQESNNVQNRKYNQMLSSYKKLAIGRFEPFQKADKTTRDAMLAAIKGWDYNTFSKLVMDVANAVINQLGSNLTPGQLLKWQSYAKYNEIPVITSLRNQEIWKSKQPYINNTYKQLNQQAKKNTRFSTLVNSNVTKSPADKIQRRNTFRMAYVAPQEMKRVLATIPQTADMTVPIPIMPTKKRKMDAILTDYQDSNGQISADVDQPFNVQGGTVSVS